MTAQDQVLEGVPDSHCRRHVHSQETDGRDLRPVSGLQDLLPPLLSTEDTVLSSHVLRDVHHKAARRRATASIQV